MDEAPLEQLDAAPLKADLDRVNAIKSKAEFANFMAASLSDYGSSLFGPGIGPDPVNPAINTLYLGTSGLGLPDRDYYLLPKYKPQLDAYRAYIQRTLTAIGDADAAAGADRIVAFETIARLSWPVADRASDAANPMTLRCRPMRRASTGWHISRMPGSMRQR
jgi:putative endopeptidase